MARARGDALDWALALARAPGERHALRQRPLPDGMESLLQIAGGGHGPALAEAVAQTGFPAGELVDAARFYVREVLFFPDADAYRVLGLSSDASDEQIKHHHRLLQQWLHPDRPASDWDAAFAARVNAAWSQLRTASRREAYAERSGLAVATPGGSDPSWSAPARIHHAPVLAGADEDRLRRRAPVLALFGVCALLGVLAVRDMQREPEGALADASVVEAEATETPAVALQLPAVVPSAKADAAAPAAKRAKSERVAVVPASSTKNVAVASRLAAKPMAVAAVPKVATPSRAVPPKPSAKPVATDPKASGRLALVAPKPAAKPTVVAVAPRIIAKPVVLAPKPSTKPVATDPKASGRLAVAAPMPLAKTAAVASKPAANSTAAAARQPTAMVVKTAKSSAMSPAAGSAQRQAATNPVAIADKPAAPRVAPAAGKSTAKPSTGAMPPSSPVASVAVVTAASPPPTTTAPAPAAASSPQQVAQAQQTGQRLLAFVAGRGGGMPPIWANFAAQTQASRAREAMQGNGRVAIGQPDWRIGDGVAVMHARLTPGDSDSRRLRVDLVWREERWLVKALALEQGP